MEELFTLRSLGKIKLTRFWRQSLIVCCMVMLSFLNLNVNAQQQECNIWTQKPDMTCCERKSAVSFVINDIAYIATGQTATGYQSDLWGYDNNTMTWTNWATMVQTVGSVKTYAPTRVDAVSFAIDGKGYVLTGNSYVGLLSDFWRYDPVMNKWSKLPDFPGGARSQAVSFVINGKAYVGTGLGFDNLTYQSILYQDMWEYNPYPYPGIWTQVDDFPGGPRTEATSFTIGDFGFVGTGSSSAMCCISYYNDFWQFDPSQPIGSQWIQINDFPGAARSGAVSFSDDIFPCEKAFVGTGANCSLKFADFYEYNLETENWTQVANLPGPAREQAVAFNIDELGFVSTGEDGCNLCHNPFLKDLWQFNPCPCCDPVTVRCPGELDACVGENITINAGYSGTEPTFKWFHNGNLLEGETSATLELTNLTLEDAGEYCFVGINECGDDTCCTNLTINTPPTITSLEGPEDCIRFNQNLPPKTFTFEVEATGHGPISYAWYHNNGTTVVKLDETSNILSFSTNSQDSVGYYIAEVINECGSVKDSLFLDKCPCIETVIIDPIDDEICEGDQGQFVVIATGTNLSYQWFTCEDVLVEGATNATFFPTDAGCYYVVVSDDPENCGQSKSSEEVTLIVHSIPEISITPLTLCLGESGELSAVVTNPEEGCEYAYLWNTGETTQTITVNPDVNTLYSVTVTNLCENCVGTSSSTVTVHTNPVVRIEDVVICAGEVASLTAVVANPEEGCDYTYLWSNGMTTSTIEVSPTETTNYTVTVVSSCNGCTGEGEGTVTVHPNVEITVNSGEICEPNGTVTLTATVLNPEDACNLTYLWSNGETTASITVSPEVNTTYSVTVTSTCENCYTVATGTATVEIKNIWEKVADIICCGRKSAVSFTIDNYGYISTGSTVNGFQNDLMRFDPISNTWMLMDSIHEGVLVAPTRDEAVGFALNGMGYVLTGNSYVGLLSDFWQYNPGTNSWTQLPDFPGGPRSQAVAFVVDGKAYVGTGLGYDPITYQGFYYQDLWQFNPYPTPTWVRMDDFAGGPRADAVAFASGNFGFIGTGLSASQCCVSHYKDMWKFNPEESVGNQWVRVEDFPGNARGGAVAFSIEECGKVYVGTGDNCLIKYDDFYAYDVENDSWGAVTEFLGVPRTQATSFVIDGSGYVATGEYLCNECNDPYLKDVWKFTPCCGCEAPVVRCAEIEPVCVGDDVTLSATAIGADLTYNWYHNGILVGTGMTLNLENVTPNSVGEYCVVVSNECGSDTCCTFLEVINNDLVIEDFTIPTACINPSIDPQEFVFNVMASSSQDITYQWYHNNVILDGETNSTLVIITNSSNQAGTYTVVVSNSCSSLSSSGVLLYCPCTPPAITAQPANEVICDGETGTFEVIATGTDLMYQWYKDDVAIENATNATLSVSEAGSYYVIVSTSVEICGDPVKSVVVELTVNELPEVVISEGDEICEGNEFSFIAEASDDVTYSWYHNGVIIPGANQATYTIFDSKAEDNGEYMVVVTNDCGSASSEVSILTILETPEVTCPEDASVCEGESASFEVTATGSPELFYQWYMNGNILNNAGVFSGTQTATLSISDVTGLSGNVFTVIVSNECGSDESCEAELTVNPLPEITTQPISVVKCATETKYYCGGSNPSDNKVCFSVVATNASTYQWQENGVNIVNGGYYSGANTPTLCISNVKGKDGNEYRVIVTNECGSVTSEVAILTISYSPIIKCKPQSTCAVEGESATFTVKAIGAISYQWQMNGYNISDNSIFSGTNTATLTINDVTGLNKKSFRVKVSNECGSVKSVSALLIVKTGCVPPTNLRTCEITSHSGKGVWNVLSGVKKYEVVYWKQGSTNKTTIYTINPKVIFTNLKVNTTYCWKVRAIYYSCGCNCNEGGVSAWSEVTCFTTTHCYCKDDNKSIEANTIVKDMKVYPNPTTGMINIAIPESSNASEIEIFNMSGQRVYSNTLLNTEFLMQNPLQVDMSKFERGVYFVKVNNEFVNKTVKLVLH